MGAKGSGNKGLGALGYDKKLEKDENGRFKPSSNSTRYTSEEVERGFKQIQAKLMNELKRRTMVGKLEGLELDDIAKIMRTCREHLHSIHIRKMSSPASNQIEFVTVAPLEKNAKD